MYVKKFTCFCQALKKCTQKCFFLPHDVQVSLERFSVTFSHFHNKMTTVFDLIHFECFAAVTKWFAFVQRQARR